MGLSRQALGSGSGQDRRDDLRGFDAGEFLVEAAVGIDEAVVVDAHLLEDGGLVVAVDGGAFRVALHLEELNHRRQGDPRAQDDPQACEGAGR